MLCYPHSSAIRSNGSISNSSTRVILSFFLDILSFFKSRYYLRETPFHQLKLVLVLLFRRDCARFVSTSPFDSPSDMVNVFKGVTALRRSRSFRSCGTSTGRESSGFPVIMWEPQGSFQQKRSSWILRSNKRGDAIHPPILMGGLLATTR